MADSSQPLVAEWQDVTSSKGEHHHCREQEVAYAHDAVGQGACAVLLNRFPTKPAFTFTGLDNFLGGFNPDKFATEAKSCASAVHNYKVSVPECKAKQRTFEDHSCAFHKTFAKAHNSCVEIQKCRSVDGYALEESCSSALTSATAWNTAEASLQQIECMIEKLKSSNFNTTEECNHENATWDTHDIECPSVTEASSEEEQCSQVSAMRKNGTEALVPSDVRWVESMYGSEAWFDVASNDAETNGPISTLVTDCDVPELSQNEGAAAATTTLTTTVLRHLTQQEVFQQFGCPLAGVGNGVAAAFDADGVFHCKGYWNYLKEDCMTPLLAEQRAENIAQMMVQNANIVLLKNDHKTVICVGVDAHCPWGTGSSHTFDKHIISLLSLSDGYCLRYEDLTVKCHVGAHGGWYRGSGVRAEEKFSGKQWRKWISTHYNACIINMENKLDCMKVGEFYPTDVPTYEVLDADCGYNGCCSIAASDGSIKCWSKYGQYDFGNVPDIKFPDSLSISEWQTIALKDGKQYGWGQYLTAGEINPDEALQRGFRNTELPADVAANINAKLFQGDIGASCKCAFLPVGSSMELKCWFGRNGDPRFYENDNFGGSSITNDKFILATSPEQCNTTMW